MQEVVLSVAGRAGARAAGGQLTRAWYGWLAGLVLQQEAALVTKQQEPQQEQTAGAKVWWS